MTSDHKNTDAENRAFLNGNIITMDDNDSMAEAVLIRGGLIEAVGSNEEVQRSVSDQDTVVDLKGHTVLPGFIDAHSHFPGSGLFTVGADLNSPPIGRIIRISQIIDALEDKARRRGKGQWILGWGYDDTLLEEKRHPNRNELDQATKTHPVYISHISGHLGVANSLALEQADIGINTPNPEGGVIRRDSATGEPNGILEETALNPVSRMAMNFSPEERISIIRTAVEDYTRAGVTTAQSGFCEESLLSGLSMASQFAQVPVRLVVWPNPELSEKVAAGEFDAGSHNTELFQVGAAKIIGDGSIQGYTAYLTKPYHVAFNDDPEYRGYPVTNRQRMVSLVKRFHRAGMQIAIHGNGDATIDDIIHSISEAQKDFPREDTRHIIVHCQTVRDDQLDEMKRLGIIPSFFSAHTYYWGDRHTSIFLGPERARRISPAKTATEKGIRFTIHVDTPVTPMKPLLLVWSAVNRVSTGGNVIGQSERISPLQALRAVTIDAAWQVFQEKNRGSIERGKFADLVILSDDPLKDPEGIRGIRVRETIVGGKTVYPGGALASPPKTGNRNS